MNSLEVTSFPVLLGHVLNVIQYPQFVSVLCQIATAIMQPNIDIRHLIASTLTDFYLVSKAYFYTRKYRPLSLCLCFTPTPPPPPRSPAEPNETQTHP